LIAIVRHDDRVTGRDHEGQHARCLSLRRRAQLMTSEKTLVASVLSSGSATIDDRRHASGARVGAALSRRGGLTLNIGHRPLVATNEYSLTAAEEAPQ
jgi:hypothetical protein